MSGGQGAGKRPSSRRSALRQIPSSSRKWRSTLLVSWWTIDHELLPAVGVLAARSEPLYYEARLVLDVGVFGLLAAGDHHVRGVGDAASLPAAASASPRKMLPQIL